MTRKKKSRKLGSNGSLRLSKDKLRELRTMKEQRTKKLKGNAAGSRNAQESKEEISTAQRQGKDSRVGSKKAISLVPEQQTVQNTAPEFKRNLKPSVELRKVNQPELTPEQELEQLESDQKLLSLIERQSAGEMIVGKDAKYLNAKVARHQKLCEILGINDDYEDKFEDDFGGAQDELDQFMSNDLADEWLDDEEER